MKLSVGLATDRIQFGSEFVGASAIAEIASAAEEAGYDACFVTDHPYPVQRWLDGGGRVAPRVRHFLVAAVGEASGVRRRACLISAEYSCQV